MITNLFGVINLYGSSTNYFIVFTYKESFFFRFSYAILEQSFGLFFIKLYYCIVMPSAIPNLFRTTRQESGKKQKKNNNEGIIN